MRTQRAQILFDVVGYFALLLLVCAVIYLMLWQIDFAAVGWSANPWRLMTQPEGVQTLTSFGEVALGILGVTITVVAIIVELAANRYTPRITELFIRDPLNICMMSFFVATAVMVVWVDLSLFHPGVYPTAMVTASVTLMTASLLMILPYFAYVFDFLSPVSVVRRIETRGTDAITSIRRTRSSLEGQTAVRDVVEHLGEIALNSVEKNDKAIGIATINALASVASVHLARKSALPDDWFEATALITTDQDFVAFHPSILTDVSRDRLWVEMKILRQYQHVFEDALHEQRDINHLVAIRTRQIAISAIEHEDGKAHALCLRFLNTFMRAAVNARDVRTCYNLLNEYRLLGEALITKGAHGEAVAVAQYVKLYGQLAFSSNIAFILESAAYDLCGLLEFAYHQKCPLHDQLLTLFLDVDREPEEGRSQEAALRGVRKAQIKLATFYLAENEEKRARRIYTDMRHEGRERLDGIRRELLSVDTSEFWEVSDRGMNFEYLPPPQRACLDVFYAWFDP